MWRDGFLFCFFLYSAALLFGFLVKPDRRPRMVVTAIDEFGNVFHMIVPGELRVVNGRTCIQAVRPAVFTVKIGSVTFASAGIYLPGCFHTIDIPRHTLDAADSLVIDPIQIWVAP